MALEITFSIREFVVGIAVKQKDLEAVLRRKQLQIVTSANKGILDGAKAGKRHLESANPRDTGSMSKAWKTKAVSLPTHKATVHNDAPHAGIVEEGARPHNVSAEGRESLRQWAVRHFPGADTATIDNIVWGTVKKLKEQGQEPTFFVKNSLDKLTEMLAKKVASRLLRIKGKA